MPLYEYRNKDTGEVITKMVKIADREQFLKDNPDLEPMISAPKIATSDSGGALKQAGDGWKEVQSRIKSGLPPRLRDNIKSK